MQAEVLTDLASRIVVPVCIASLIKNPISILNPVLEIEGKKYVALFDELSSYPAGMLPEEVVNLEALRGDFMKAYDFLIQGY